MSSRLSTLTSAQRTAYQSLSIHPHPYARLPMGIRPGTGKRAPPSSDAMEVGRDGEAGGGHGHLRHGAQTVAAKGGRAQGSMAKRRKELLKAPETPPVPLLAPSAAIGPPQAMVELDLSPAPSLLPPARPPPPPVPLLAPSAAIGPPQAMVELDLSPPPPLHPPPHPPPPPAFFGLLDPSASTPPRPVQPQPPTASRQRPSFLSAAPAPSRRRPSPSAPLDSPRSLPQPPVTPAFSHRTAESTAPPAPTLRPTPSFLGSQPSSSQRELTRNKDGQQLASLTGPTAKSFDPWRARDAPLPKLTLSQATKARPRPAFLQPSLSAPARAESRFRPTKRRSIPPPPVTAPFGRSLQQPMTPRAPDVYVYVERPPDVYVHVQPPAESSRTSLVASPLKAGKKAKRASMAKLGTPSRQAGRTPARPAFLERAPPMRPSPPTTSAFARHPPPHSLPPPAAVLSSAALPPSRPLGQMRITKRYPTARRVAPSFIRPLAPLPKHAPSFLTLGVAPVQPAPPPPESSFFFHAPPPPIERVAAPEMTPTTLAQPEPWMAKKESREEKAVRRKKIEVIVWKRLKAIEEAQGPLSTSQQAALLTALPRAERAAMDDLLPSFLRHSTANPRETSTVTAPLPPAQQPLFSSPTRSSAPAPPAVKPIPPPRSVTRILRDKKIRYIAPERPKLLRKSKAIPLEALAHLKNGALRASPPHLPITKAKAVSAPSPPSASYFGSARADLIPPRPAPALKKQRPSSLNAAATVAKRPSVRSDRPSPPLPPAARPAFLSAVAHPPSLDALKQSPVLPSIPEAPPIGWVTTGQSVPRVKKDQTSQAKHKALAHLINGAVRASPPHLHETKVEPDSAPFPPSVTHFGSATADVVPAPPAPPPKKQRPSFLSAAAPVAKPRAVRSDRPHPPLLSAARPEFLSAVARPPPPIALEQSPVVPFIPDGLPAGWVTIGQFTPRSKESQAKTKTKKTVVSASHGKREQQVKKQEPSLFLQSQVPVALSTPLTVPPVIAPPTIAAVPEVVPGESKSERVGQLWAMVKSREDVQRAETRAEKMVARSPAPAAMAAEVNVAKGKELAPHLALAQALEAEKIMPVAVAKAKVKMPASALASQPAAFVKEESKVVAAQPASASVKSMDIAPPPPWKVVTPKSKTLKAVAVPPPPPPVKAPEIPKLLTMKTAPVDIPYGLRQSPKAAVQPIPSLSMMRTTKRILPQPSSSSSSSSSSSIVPPPHTVLHPIHPSQLPPHSPRPTYPTAPTRTPPTSYFGLGLAFARRPSNPNPAQAASAKTTPVGTSALFDRVRRVDMLRKPVGGLRLGPGVGSGVGLGAGRGGVRSLRGEMGMGL